MFSLADHDKFGDDAASGLVNTPPPGRTPSPRLAASHVGSTFPRAPISSETTVPARYGEDGRSRLPALVAVLALHAAAGALLLQQGYVAVTKKADRLEMVKLSVSPPPPPPPSDPVTPPPATPQIVSPPPIVRTPVAPVVQVAVTPVAVPVVSSNAVPTLTEPSARALPAAAPAARTETVDSGDLGTRMISAKPPKYPIESRRKREQGTVVLSLVLARDGSVSSLSVAQSSGFTRLDNAARDAVKRWRWAPTLRGGEPVMVRGLVEIPFVLSN